MLLSDYLRQGVDGLVPSWNARTGQLDDPVVGEPTQYGTAYFALITAAVGRHDLAATAAATALAHLADGEQQPAVSSVRAGALQFGRGNHRDFMWPAMLRTADLLRAAGHIRSGALDAAVGALAVPDTFKARPPSNWSAVWLSGEWRRIVGGASPYTIADVDAWLEPFFAERIDLEQGMYREPGLPNSYDLFTRVHLQDMVATGYDGRFRSQLDRLAETGLRRTLGVQLSDGSVASAHRSTAQTWTLGAQLALLGAARAAGYDVPAGALARAHAALMTTLRPDGTISPVQNGLPAGLRIGYEGYTADAHYTSLALGFVVAAIRDGLDGAVGVDAPSADAAERDATHIEHDPTYRALRHRGRWSVHVNLDPHPHYDGFGIVDLTTGTGRRLQFVSSAAIAGATGFVNLGIAARDGDTVHPVAHRQFARNRSFTSSRDGLSAEARDDAGAAYRVTVRLGPETATVEESLPGNGTPLTLLVPYPRDVGDGALTDVRTGRDAVTLTHGAETVRITPEAPIRRIIHLPGGLTNRRGLCGLVRIDLDDPRDALRYAVTVVS